MSDSKEKSISESIENQFDDFFAPKKPDEGSDTAGKPSAPAIPPVKKDQQKVLPEKPSNENVTLPEAPPSKKEPAVPDMPPAKTTRQKFAPNKTMIDMMAQAVKSSGKKAPVTQDTPVVKEEASTGKDTDQPAVENVFKKANQQYKKNIIWEKTKQSLYPVIFTFSILLLVIFSMFIGKILIPDEMMESLNIKKSSTPVNLTVSPGQSEKRVVSVSKNIKTSSSDTVIKEPKIEKSAIQEAVTKKEEVVNQEIHEAVVPAKTADEPHDIIKELFFSYPYSVYLGSYNSIDSVQTASSDFAKKEITTYWIKLDLGEKGIWFRLFTGYFKTREDADQFIKTRQIKEAESKLTKYTSLIGIYDSKEHADTQKAHLEELGYSPYIINDSDNAYRLYTGAFYQKDRADELKKDLEFKGIKNEIVER